MSSVHPSVRHSVRLSWNRFRSITRNYSIFLNQTWYIHRSGPELVPFAIYGFLILFILPFPWFPLRQGIWVFHACYHSSKMAVFEWFCSEWLKKKLCLLSKSCLQANDLDWYCCEVEWWLFIVQFLSLTLLHPQFELSHLPCILQIFFLLSCDTDGQWELGNYHLLELGRRQHAVRCMVSVHSSVWCGLRNKILVLDPKTLQVQVWGLE